MTEHRSSTVGTRTLVAVVPDWPVVAADVAPGQAVAVVRASRVVAVSPAARAEGIRVGLRRREAQARFAHLTLVPWDLARDVRAFEPVVAGLHHLTPRVEITRPGRCAIETRGPSRRLGGDHELARLVRTALQQVVGDRAVVHAGVADGPFAAAIAAEEDAVLAPGTTAGWLAPLPVSRLGEPDGPLPGAQVELLHRLGIRTLGALAALGGPEVLARFGTEGQRAHRLAQGLDEQPLLLGAPPIDLSVRTELDPPAERVETAAFAARALAEELHARLAARGEVCTRVLITAETEHGERRERLWRHEGSLTAAAIADRVRWQLDGWLQGPVATRPTAGIAVLGLVPDQRVAATGTPLRLWDGRIETIDRVERAVTRLSSSLGCDAVTVGQWRGGRDPAEEYVPVPAIEVPSARARREPASTLPWPGRLPSPSPAVVLAPAARPAAEVVDAGGAPVGVDGRAGPVRSPGSAVDRGRAVAADRGVGRALADRGALVGPGAPPAPSALPGGDPGPLRLPAGARGRPLAGRRALRLMGWTNPPISWAELERCLSRGEVPKGVPVGADGNDSPAWSHHRDDYVRPPGLVRRPSTARYAELHCHSHFSFLDGAAGVEELVEEAHRLDLEALALTDHDGLYGVVRFAEAARVLELPTVFGAELSLGLARSQGGNPDPDGEHLVVLARGPDGYRHLSRAISDAQLAGREKGRPLYDLADLAAAHHGEWAWLTGCRKGTVPAALLRDGPAAAARALAQLVELAGGRDHVFVELWDHGDPLDAHRNDAMAELAARAGVGVVATNNVHYHAPHRRALATAMAAVRARRSLDDLDGWIPAAATAHLRSGDEQARHFRRYPGVLDATTELARACAFDLQLIAPNLPRFDACPEGMDERAYLRHLVDAGARRRYGPGDTAEGAAARARLDHELALIEDLGWPGYFLIVWDIVRFCDESNIYVQGRGSAVGSAVCFTLGITHTDPLAHGLLFERFLSSERGAEPPDIDLDIESKERERAIQYVYDKYGRRHAAQVANVISYRARSAVRDMAKALGFSPGQQDAWSRQIQRGAVVNTMASDEHDIPGQVLALAAQLEHAPRHLGIHSGGMVLCDRPIAEVCPIEWARREDRSVLQWDKDDCERAGLVKIDLLGLGMLSALHGTIDLANRHHGLDLTLRSILAAAEDPAVYDMLCAADAVGVFQVESRAQMQTAPRLRPRTLYDLTVQIALIRPGPIQGQSVHPYLRRRSGEEEVTYLHPLLEPILERTKGVPLFQEQLMEIARSIGGFSAGEADDLRRAMASKRSEERMERLRGRLFEGMAANGITDEIAEQLWAKLAAFSSYGFPESHAMAFASLAYASSWLKRWFPAAFLAGLLNAQPMGFYSPHSLVQDARRHGVTVLTPDLNASGAGADLAPGDRAPQRAARGAPPREWGVDGPAVRLGIGSVRNLNDALAERVDAGRPYASMEDLVLRVPELTLTHLEALATAGAFGCFGLTRRAALWAAGAVVQARSDRLEGVITGDRAPMLPGMSPAEEANADLWATGISPDGHPTRFLRAVLEARGVTLIERLAEMDSNAKVTIAGVVTHRQRPPTARGVTFLSIEDETGLVNVTCSAGCWQHHRRVARDAPALLIRGRLERTNASVNVIAHHLECLPIRVPAPSRDFR